METYVEAAQRAINTAGGPYELAKKLLPPGTDDDAIQRMSWRIAKWRKNGIQRDYVRSVSEIANESVHDLLPSSVLTDQHETTA